MRHIGYRNRYICAVTNRHIKVIMDKYKIKYSELC